MARYYSKKRFRKNSNTLSGVANQLSRDSAKAQRKVSKGNFFQIHACVKYLYGVRRFFVFFPSYFPLVGLGSSFFFFPKFHTPFL